MIIDTLLIGAYSNKGVASFKISGPKLLVINDAYFTNDLLEPWDVGALSISKTADLLLQLRVDTFPCFVAIGFYFLSENLI
jgi:hypothetical protein